MRLEGVLTEELIRKLASDAKGTGVVEGNESSSDLEAPIFLNWTQREIEALTRW